MAEFLPRDQLADFLVGFRRRVIEFPQKRGDGGSFGVGNGPAEDAEPELFQSHIGLRELGDEMLGQRRGAFAEQFVIHHEQSLRGDDRLRTLAGDLGRVDEVEVRANAIEIRGVRSHDGQVDRPLKFLVGSGLAMIVVGRVHALLHESPAVLDFFQHESWAAMACEQFAANRQQTVANRFGIEPLAIHPPQQPVVGIDLHRGCVVRAAQSVGPTQYQRADQLLLRPAVLPALHESRGEMIEQFRM